MFLLKFSPPSLHNCQFLKAKETTNIVNNTKKHRQSKTGNYRKIKLWRKVIRSLKIWSQYTSQRKGKRVFWFFYKSIRSHLQGGNVAQLLSRGQKQAHSKKNTLYHLQTSRFCLILPAYSDFYQNHESWWTLKIGIPTAMLSYERLEIFLNEMKLIQRL